jgi:hypothetical protein
MCETLKVNEVQGDEDLAGPQQLDNTKGRPVNVCKCEWVISETATSKC